VDQIPDLSLVLNKQGLYPESMGLPFYARFGIRFSHKRTMQSKRKPSLLTEAIRVAIG
jgi:hypothetical protein